MDIESKKDKDKVKNITNNFNLFEKEIDKHINDMIDIYFSLNEEAEDNDDEEEW